MALDEHLETWADVQAAREFSGILVGNGASRAVWERFEYSSLYRVARDQNATHRLASSDISLFDALNTRNFEYVLAALATARRVNEALSVSSPIISERYTSIQQALVEAIRTTHVPWGKVSRSALEAIRSALLDYRFVYSTNYDLLIDWALMIEDGEGFKDFFWAPYFDPGNTDLWGKTTAVVYLHGGLHLYRTLRGRTLKRAAEPSQNLLELFGTEPEPGATPLFISEGAPEDKAESIYRSDYLSFAYTQLAHHDGPLCVFGHSLGDVDRHITAAIRQAGIRDIACSLRQGPRDTVVAKKAEIISRLPESNLIFYDASTHPLGATDLRVSPN